MPISTLMRLVSDLYIHTFGPPIFLQQNRQTHQRIIENAHRNMNVGVGTVAAQFLSWEYLFRIFASVSLQCINQEMVWKSHKESFFYLSWGLLRYASLAAHCRL